MHIQVSGQHISIGSSIQEYVIEKLSNIVKKYFAGAQSGHVHFSKQTASCNVSEILNLTYSHNSPFKPHSVLVILSL